MLLKAILLICGVLVVCEEVREVPKRIAHPACPYDGFYYYYINETLGWVGLGWAWTTEQENLRKIALDVEYATVAQTNTKKLGSLKMLSAYNIKHNFGDQRWNIIYELKFPTQDPLPNVTKIVLNGDTVCNDTDKAFTSEKPLLVKMHLTYNYHTKKQKLTTELLRKPRRNNTQTVTINQQMHVVEPNENLGCGRADLANIFVPLQLEGKTIQRGTWPWLVSVYAYTNLKLGFRCGATLISKKLVVTAAHCFIDIYDREVKTEDVLIILGQYNLKRPRDFATQVVYPDSVNIHPHYRMNNKIDSDIAVIVMAKSVVFTTYIQPACLWDSSDSKKEIIGKIGFTAGWGRDENGNFFTELPKQVEIPVVSDKTCLRSHEAFSRITSEKTFCAGWRNGTEGPCNGDSGGPLVFQKDGRWTLRGVVSTSLLTDGSNTCNLNEYVVFTDVAKFTDWIIAFDSDYYY